MNLQWTSSASLSCIHAAWCCLNFPEHTGNVSSELKTAAGELEGCLKHAEQVKQLTPGIWSTLRNSTPQATLLPDSNEKQVPVPHGNGSDTGLQAAIRNLQGAFHAAYPDFENEMAIRSGPIRQQWEAYGPGLMNLIRKFLRLERRDESATIVLIQPLLGGYGHADHNTASVHLEAVLTNSEPDLPETLRMAWLLSCLRGKQEVEESAARDRDQLAALALIPATLQAGADLGITEFSLEACTRAVSCWQADLQLQNLDPTLPERVMQWWDNHKSQTTKSIQKFEDLKMMLPL